MNPTDSAADALENFASGPGADAANGLADVFEQAGDRIANSLERAAQSGELSFNSLAESIANDFARFAVGQLITAPLEGLVSSLTSSFAGAISGGGSPVTVNLQGRKLPAHRLRHGWRKPSRRPKGGRGHD